MDEILRVQRGPQSAAEAHDLGMSVVRLQEPRPGDPDSGKATAGRWKHLQSIRSTKQEAEAIGGQYGIITGRVSQIVVVDVDGIEAERWVAAHLIETPMRTKTAKGFHLYFRHPGIEVRNGAKLKGLPLDVRGDGGYVVGPGSVHWTGKRYEAVGDWSSIEKLPVFDPSWLEEVRKFDSTTVEPGPADAVRRAASYISRIEGAVSGQGGHAKTMRVAGVLVQRFGLSVEQALPLMILWNSTCSPKWSEKELLHKLVDAVKNLGSQRGKILKTIGD